MTTSSLLSQFAKAIASGAIRIIDLSQTMSPDTKTIVLPQQFGKSWPFHIEEISKYDDRGPNWYWNNFSCGEHTGTHFDAPIHWNTGKAFLHNSTDTIEVKKFIAPAIVVNVVLEAQNDPDFLLTKNHILKWEEEFGVIPEGCWVLMRTDWSKRNGHDFLNIIDGVAHSPGAEPEVIDFLCKERKIIGWGSECVGQDAGQADKLEPPIPCHHIMHGANKFGLASLVNLDLLPPTGAVLITNPLKIINGSGSPCRVLALV